MKQNKEKPCQNNITKLNTDIEKKSSMSSLIIWNITKALEMNPDLNLKKALVTAQERLDQNPREVNMFLSEDPEGRHLACALLAWQRLGHRGGDSLHQFYETRKTEENEADCRKKHCVNEVNLSTETANIGSNLNYYEPQNEFRYSAIKNEKLAYSTSPVGPVIKLPVQTKIVMRLENTSTTARQSNAKEKSKEQEKDIMTKIDAACCLDSGCAERLAAMEATTNELRTRAIKLARREAERVELLERAEAAWKDLELGYERRLTLAEEKEEDLTKQIKKIIEDRNGYKNDCTTMAEQLKCKVEAAEKDRSRLKDVEKEINGRACIRLKLSEEMARGDAVLADAQCKSAQLTRDLRFKEEQVRRKLSTISSDAESARALAIEAERAMRDELGALRDQMTNVSTQLLEEDAENCRIKNELEQLRQTKLEMVEDLEGCKIMCDDRMQGKLDELKSKKEELKKLREKVIDCQCKLPIDVTVEVKRTPSLAATCSCSPDKMTDSCSCTSLRSKLFSNLLSDLFRGLQEELGDIGSQMPCQLLKCLEDKYNWDKSSVVKTNIKNYFSTLLTGELDIAIGTSIEKYHAQWVGASCVDEAKLTMETEDTNESWQQHAIECRAQKLATQLAEQLFQQQADQIVQQARDIVKSGHPCDCKPPSVAYPCVVNEAPFDGERLDDTTRDLNRFVRQDLTQYRVQLEDHKKVRHSDRAVLSNNENNRLNNNKPYLNATYDGHNENRSFNTVKKTAVVENKLSKARSRNISSTSRNYNEKQDKFQKKIEKVKNSFAVNLCLCDTDKKDSSKVNHRGNAQQMALNKDKVKVKQKVQRDSKDFVAPQISSIKQTKPINTITSSPVIDKLKKNGTSPIHRSCQSGCVCLHKIPSNTSIDALLKTLATYKNELNTSEKVVEQNVESVSSPVKSSTKTSFDSKNKKDSGSKLDEVEEKEEIVISKSSTIPKATESEFMGTINYEKSCKCIPSDFFDRENLEVEGNNTLRSNYKCVNSAECQCGKTIQSDKITSEQQTMPKQINDLCSFTQTNKTQSEKSVQNLVSEKKFNIETKSNSNGTPEDVPCVCKFSINLLGVTLTDTTSKDENKVTSGNNEQKHVFNSSNFQETTQPVHDPETVSTKIFNMNCQDAVTNICHEINLKEHNIPINENMNQTNDDAIAIKEKQKESSSLCSSNTTNIDSRDLEENTFFLLEKYLRKKLQEFKATCEAASIPFQEEEKIMLKILKKIKETISEAECKISCTCSAGETPEGSWDRAYSLLQEYIKAKMKRAQCTCALDKGTIKTTCMDGLLTRISSLIEYDFRRIQELYKNKSDRKIGEDIPEKDTNHPMIQKYKKSIEVTKSDRLGLKTETNTMSCQAFIVNDKKMVESATKAVQISKMSNNNISKLVGFDLDEENFSRSISGNLTSIGKVLELLVDKVLPNESKNILQNKANTYTFQPDSQTVDKDQNNALNYNQNIVNVVGKNTSNKLTDSVEPLPYIGCTIDCVCDKNIGSCICIKSAVKQNTSKIADLWSTFLRENNKYVLDSTRLMDNMLSRVYSGKDKQVFDLERSEEEQQQLMKKEEQACETMTDAPSVDNIILKVSTEVCNVAVNFNEMTNTFDDSDTLETCLSDNDIEEWSEAQPSFKLQKSFDKTKSQLHSQIHEIVELKNDTTGLTSGICDCNKVPVCHVKLLVDNIEQKLMQSECTCDSLSSNVCPVHSLKYF